jgi:hypothetical protein
MTTPSLAAALAATASLAVAACGVEDPTPAAGSRRGPDAATKQAMLQYAQCMRDHGIDMPDPQFSGGRVTMSQGARRVDPQRLRTAQKACQSIQDKIKPPPMSAQERERFKQMALANARCMRAHGITNFPDPTFDGNGGAQIRLGKGSGLDPNDPKFQAAQKACAKEGGIGGGPSTTSVDR